MAFDSITTAQSKAERFARLRLARTSRIGPINFAQLMSRFGSAEHAIDALPSIIRRTAGALMPPPVDKVEAELVRGCGWQVTPTIPPCCVRSWPSRPSCGRSGH